VTTAAVDPALTAAVPGPILAVLGAVALAIGVITDVRGMWNGPVSRVKARQEANAVGPGADLSAMQGRLDLMAKEMSRMQRTLDHQTRRLDDAQQREEIRDRLAAEHRRWDVAVVNKLIDLGVNDMPDPPPLHVHPDYVPRENP
jgi:hypothetical protein